MSAGNEESVQREALAERVAQLRRFLNGEASIDMVWFGEDHPEIKGRFWWRSYFMGPLLHEVEAALRALPTPSTPEAQQEGVEEIAASIRRRTSNAVAEIALVVCEAGATLGRAEILALHKIIADRDEVMRQHFTGVPAAKEGR